MAGRPGLAGSCEAIYRAALVRVAAGRLVREALDASPPPAGPIRVAALGKAAGAMLEFAVAPG